MKWQHETFSLNQCTNNQQLTRRRSLVQYTIHSFQWTARMRTDMKLAWYQMCDFLVTKLFNCHIIKSCCACNLRAPKYHPVFSRWFNVQTCLIMNGRLHWQLHTLVLYADTRGQRPKKIFFGTFSSFIRVALCEVSLPPHVAIIGQRGKSPMQTTFK